MPTTTPCSNDEMRMTRRPASQATPGLGLSVILFLGVFVTPSSALSESGCAKQYAYATQIVEALVAYHQASSPDNHILWQKAENLYDKMGGAVDPSEDCDLATSSRALLASVMLSALSIGNGQMPDTQGNIKVAIQGLLQAVKTPGTDYAADFTQFNDLAASGFNEDFFRWLLQHMLDIYQRDHYFGYALPGDTIKGLQYFFPNFDPST